MSYGVGFVGTGYMAAKHAAVLREDPRARLVAAVGGAPTSARAREFVDAHGFARLVDTVDDLLADDSIEIVFVCTPDATHAEYVTRALSAGKHVLCEKPLARTAADIVRIQESVARSGKVLQVGMNCRFRIQYANVHERAQGSLGALRFLRGTYVINSVKPVRLAEKPWHLDVPPGYLPFLYSGALHCLDLMRWVAGPIRSVFARAAGFELAHEWGLDTFSASLEFAGGTLGEFTSSASAFRPPDFALEAWFERGSVVGGSEFGRTGDAVDPIGSPLPTEQPRIDLALQFDDMLAAIETGRPPANSADGALANFRVLAAIQRSITDGRSVAVDGTFAATPGT